MAHQLPGEIMSTTFVEGSDRHVRGLKAEDEYASHMREQGWTVSPSNAMENRRDHVDFFLEKDGVRMRVDVKACKRVLGQFRDDLLWIETDAEWGLSWLWGKVVTHIAFQNFDGTFLTVPIDILQELAKTTYKNANTVTTFIPALLANRYKFALRRAAKPGQRTYTRERVILMSTKDICDLMLRAGLST